MEEKILVTRRCPLCNSNNSKVKYNRNYTLKELKSDLFSARRERRKKVYEHNTFVICKKCNLIYSNPIINPALIEKLYKKSRFNYGSQEHNLRKSYGEVLRKASKYLKKKDRLLDIGCGNGFFLLEALEQGYKEVYGIEPSRHAVDLADPRIKNKIKISILRENQFEPAFFDAVCLFQVIDHIEEPNKVLSICSKYLKKDGIIIIISHNVNALSSLILGERSPIFDIEHTQLFSKKTISRILINNGFKILEISDLSNIYTLDYWLGISPLPKFIKISLKKVLSALGLSDKNIKIKPGNFYAIAKRV